MLATDGKVSLAVFNYLSTFTTGFDAGNLAHFTILSGSDAREYVAAYRIDG